MINKIRNFLKKNKQQNNNLTGEAYKGFVNFALDNSDYFTFHLPNYNHFIITDKNSDLLPDELKVDILDLADNKQDNKEYVEYKSKTADIIDIIRNQIVSSVYDAEYLNQIYNYGTEAYVVKISDKESCYNFLMSAKSLFSWRANNLPEDICFFSNGICWLKIISHSEMIIANVTNELEEQLKNFGISFNRFEKDIKLPFSECL